LFCQELFAKNYKLQAVAGSLACPLWFPLTFNTYARSFEKAKQKAMNFLPNFGDFVLSTSLEKVCRKQEISTDSHRHKNSQDTLKTIILAVK
jgi:hypothetical protein